MPLTETLTGSTGTRTLFDSTVYLKETPTFDVFSWGGRCMRLDGESTETLGAMTVTHRQNPRGGVERDGVMVDPDAETTFTLMMKHQQADRQRTALKKCFWIVDLRWYCTDKDAWNGWLEIVRSCTCKANQRTMSGSAYDPSNAEAMVGIPETCLFTEDIYRVASEEHTF